MGVFLTAVWVSLLVVLAYDIFHRRHPHCHCICHRRIPWVQDPIPKDNITNPHTPGDCDHE